MKQLARYRLDELEVLDERSFRHVGVYQELRGALASMDAQFLVADPKGPLAAVDPVSLLNLAYWAPGGALEVLAEPALSADQLAHNAWHRVAERALGEHARTADGLLLAEAVASAFDLYAVGRLLGHAPESEFLETQVPAMSDAAAAAGLDEAGFEALLQRSVAEPEACFELLRELLFDTSVALVAAPDLEAAAEVLSHAARHPLGALLYHYELTTWVLFARAYATSLAPCPDVRAIDAELRAAPDAMAWLERRWLARIS